jgi:tetratricopeptide (TPR) repeat protein
MIPLLEEGLAALGEDDVELRVRLLARLAGALRDELPRDRREALSRDAVALARRSGSLGALAYALDGRVPAIIAPDTLDECSVLADELREVAEQVGDGVRLAHGHLHWAMPRLMGGDVERIDEALDAINTIAEQLREPFLSFEVRAGQAALALTSGRLEEAEELIERAFELGESIKAEIAVPIYQLQRYSLADLRGKSEQLGPALEEIVEAHPARVVFRCALTHLHARCGHMSDAERLFGALAHDNFAAVPFDQEWLLATSYLAETAALLDDAQAAAELYSLLVPYASLSAADWPEAFRGSMSRYLAVLATATGAFDDAVEHFEAALAMNARMAARPWLALTQRDYAELLVARGGVEDRARAEQLLLNADVLGRELGLALHA